MRGPILFVMVVIVAVSFTAPVNAQFADDNVKSDGYGNTAAGTDALFTLSPSKESSLGCSATEYLCISNTALGNNALFNNTIGDYNVAAGAGALYSNSQGKENIAIGVNALYNNTNDDNTAVGYEALVNNTGGYFNAAVGNAALATNQTGNSNTATGSSALYYNDNGGTGASFNTADGADAMAYNTSGTANTAVGYQAMQGQEFLPYSTGFQNTAIGVEALFSYSTGSNNTAAGVGALRSNSTGSYNTASGADALYSNKTGVNNTAIGYQALYSNNGNGNAAQGTDALYKNDSGIRNLGLGVNALYNNTSGSYNVGLGYEAGYNLNTGSNNIDIGSPGLAGDSGMIRIGTISSTNVSTQTATYIAGISGTTVSGAYVCVSSKGQLGTNSTSCATPSSRRYKEDIQPMAELSERLLKLRPVTFRYKTADADGNKSLQYGLIAEEVAEVFPELVVFDNDGQPDAVKYQVLTPMLLNEVQKQAAEIRDLKQQQKQSVAQAEQLRDVQHQLAAMRATLLKLQVKDELVAQR